MLIQPVVFGVTPDSQQDESVTAYTVFCAEQANCQIAAELPFVFTEGAETLIYSGSDPGTLFVPYPKSWA